MKTLALISTLLFSLPLLADLKIELTTDKAQAVTGEQVAVRVRVTNTAAFAVAANIDVGTFEHPDVEIRYTSTPAGWQCHGTSNCFTTSLAADSSVDFVGFLITPSRAVPNLRLIATVQGGGDTDSSNNSVAVPLPVTAASNRADLEVTGAPTLNALPSTEVTHEVRVRNAGPHDAQNVTATFGFGWDGPATYRIAGNGWTCAGLVCTRPLLAANSDAPLVVTFTTPAVDAFTVLIARVFAERNFDQTGAGLVTTIYTGDRGQWRMRLVPTSLLPVNGANNSRWTTDITMFVRSGELIEIEPDGCEPGAPECAFSGDAPLRQPFDPRRHFPASFVGGHFVWVRADRFDEVSVNARVYDANRITQTAGAELPIPRDDEFTSDVITLLDIPVAAQFRHTLRIYDDAARDGVQVLIRIYADDEIEPRVVMTQTLRSKDAALRAGTARLPVYPAMAELQLSQLLPLEGLESLRVELQPLGNGTRLWSFVTITNNETHHVTTVTPQ